MEKIKLIPEYKSVSKLLLSFVHEFFNTRFKVGKAICQMVEASLPFVKVEIFVSEEDYPHLEKEFILIGLNIEDVKICLKSPGRAIMSEWAPIIGCNSKGNLFGITFEWLRNHKDYDESDKKCEDFGKWLVKYLGIEALELGFEFASAAVSVSDDIVFISEAHLGKDREYKLRKIKDLLGWQEVYPIPALPGDVTGDLDMFLWPIDNENWICSEYPQKSDYMKSINRAVNILKDYQKTIHFVPGLKEIKYDDINTIPNYTNGVILNDAVLVPSYKRAEDAIVQKVLRDLGYKVFSIDATNVILMQSAMHCLSRTIPA